MREMTGSEPESQNVFSKVTTPKNLRCRKSAKKSIDNCNRTSEEEDENGANSRCAGCRPKRESQKSQISTPQNSNPNSSHDENSELLKLFNQSDTELQWDRFMQLIEQTDCDINQCDARGRTVVHKVAELWSVDVLQRLIELGADCAARDRFGVTPLHLAAGFNRQRMCQLLLQQQGVDKEAAEHRTNHTALFFAARNDASKAVHVLCQNQCSMEARDFRMRTPLFLAAELDRSEAARELIKCGADVGVQDDSGQPVLVPIIERMTPVASTALDTLNEFDRSRRKQNFRLKSLDPRNENDGGKSPFKTVIEAAVETSSRDVLNHPVMERFIKVQWDNFGRYSAIAQLISQLCFISLWTAFALVKPWYSRYSYNLQSAEDIARMVLLALAILSIIVEVCIDIREYRLSVGKLRRWREHRKTQINQEMEILSEVGDFSREADYLKDELEEVESQTVEYWYNYWNYFDWLTYICLFIALLLHFFDIGWYGSEGNLNIGRWHVRVLAAGIIMLWIRLLKAVRPFKFFGPFVVMLGRTAVDLVKFLFFYLEFFIPFACIFWIIIGGVNNIRSADITVSHTYPNYTLLNRTGATVPYFTTFDDMLFMMFRLTLVDVEENMFSQMYVIDKYTCQVITGLWFAFSTILFLNLFIAQLSETYKNVYDNASLVAINEKASFMIEVYDKMLPILRRRYHRYLNRHCSPLILPFDDDSEGTMDSGDLLRKATLQIRDTVQQLQSQLQAALLSPESEEAADPDSESLAVGLELKEEINELKKQCSTMQTDITYIKTMLYDIALVATDGRIRYRHNAPDATVRAAGDGTAMADARDNEEIIAPTRRQQQNSAGDATASGTIRSENEIHVRPWHRVSDLHTDDEPDV